MKFSVKKALRDIAKIILFLVLFFALYISSKDVLCGTSTNASLRIIAKQPKNTYDVILAGPSHMQWAVQPAHLFGEYGIVSCNTGSAAQSIPTSYYVIKEMIEQHDPELVVLDLFCLFYPEKYFSPTRVHQAFDDLPLSRNKIEAINDLVAEGKEEYFITYILYHGRWKSLKEGDYVPLANFSEKYRIQKGLTSFEKSFVPVDSKETAEIPEIPLEYLKRTVDLCKETDTKLLLTVIPYRADVDNNDTSAILQQKMYNKVEQLAKEWGVDYLNGLHYLDEMGFDFMTDMLEYSHVNASGSEKVSAFYGKYIKEHYDLPNHSDDAAFASWHEDYEAYLLDLATKK